LDQLERVAIRVLDERRPKAAVEERVRSPSIAGAGPKRHLVGSVEFVRPDGDARPVP
jgi:hypothetical protein